MFIYSHISFFSIRLNWTFELLLLTVGKLHIVAIVWSLMTLFTSFAVFYSTYIWANNRKFARFYLSIIPYFEYKNKLIRFYYLEIYDTTWLWIYICYLTGLLVLPCWQIIKHQLPIVSSSIILAEQVCSVFLCFDKNKYLFRSDN
jgi:hypothetical protein